MRGALVHLMLLAMCGCGKSGGSNDAGFGDGYGDDGGGGDIFKHFNHQVRATCKAGEVILPREMETFEADWIEKVELGPHRYEYVQTYDLDGESYTLTFGATQMQYLDADLNVIDTAAITSYIVGW